MDFRPTLTGSTVRLEPLDPAHALALAAAGGEDRTTFAFTSVPDGEEAARLYVADALAERDRGDAVPFATRRLADGRIVGSTRFVDVRPWTWPSPGPLSRADRPDAVEIGWTWLAPSAQRAGVNVEAKLLMLAHAFGEWDVHRVRLRTDARNVRSRRAIEALGATYEGILRADKPGADGTVRDSAMYSVIAVEWPGVHRRLLSRLEDGRRHGAHA